ncbi:helix-turn-helix transcriptional regulator [Lentilactobacillus parafarraginis]|uniref:Helix-turn-helix transcriptional regulator n=1 Tax=Lentilactobacillus parafarraginis TaxID=390842 RepID=A0A5R9CWZ1_9LACO|nr:helix-turn-helix transcriptional regulator [Lentilactobacillus parafarraginis]TLQ20136.1 helix-turn-helix transcriptional regulator [Lentilactobacillus parafarraginis]
MKNQLSTILGSRLLKIDDVIKATGINRGTLTNIYYMRADNVQLKTLIKICDYLQIPLSQLIEYKPISKE